MRFKKYGLYVGLVGVIVAILVVASAVGGGQLFTKTVTTTGHSGIDIVAVGDIAVSADLTFGQQARGVVISKFVQVTNQSDAVITVSADNVSSGPLGTVFSAINWSAIAGDVQPGNAVSGNVTFTVANVAQGSKLGPQDLSWTVYGLPK